LNLDAANLRIRRGSVPASTQLAEALKTQIIQQRLPRGGRLPSERELICPNSYASTGVFAMGTDPWP
jgi:GntR family transcriptional regulator